MKKFTIRGVLDGLRSAGSSGSSSSSTPKAEAAGIEETIWSEHFRVAKTVRHGFPYQPTALAYDPVQNLVAVGTKSGSIRIFGRPGVDCHVKHETEFAVIQLLFLVNEGAMVSVCADDQLHLWTLRQKKPEVVHSLKFQRERITCCHLPFQSKWMYVGTERGNVHVMNLESFSLSGYVIMWNKTIELLRKTHPGPVVHLSDNQTEPNKLLIGYETGLVVLWDLKEKTPEFRYNYVEGVSLKSVSWHHEGKQFVCSHSDGSLSFWNTKMPQKPISSMMPHSKLSRDGKPEPCRPIVKVDLRTVRSGDPFVIFSGGMPYEKSGHTPTMTIMRGSSTTVLEMDHPVVDFVTICSTPWNNDFQDPTAIVVLLASDFVVVDLTTPGYPCFENPYQMDLHESAVTSCLYFADCPHDLVPAFYSVGCRQKKTGYSDKEWPIKGGEWGATTCSYPEIILTGHADGSIKFWDASAVTLQVLYKLKTAKLFDTSRSISPDAGDFPFAVHIMSLCVDSRLLCVAGNNHVALFRFSKQENVVDLTTLEITIVYDACDGGPDSPADDFSNNRSRQSTSASVAPSGGGSVGSYSSAASNDKELQTSLKTKIGPRKWASGYQPDICCLLTWIDGEPAPPVTSLALNSRFGLLAYGNECGLAIVDIVQKTCLLNIGTPDLYGSMDPHSRAPHSRTQPDGVWPGLTPDDCKSPVVDQCSSGEPAVTIATLAAINSGKHSPVASSPPVVSVQTPSPNCGGRRTTRTEQLPSISELSSDTATPSDTGRPKFTLPDTTDVVDSSVANTQPVCQTSSKEGVKEKCNVSRKESAELSTAEKNSCQRSCSTSALKSDRMTPDGSTCTRNGEHERSVAQRAGSVKTSDSVRRASAPYGGRQAAKELTKLHLPPQSQSDGMLRESQAPATSDANCGATAGTVLRASRSSESGISPSGVTDEPVLHSSCGSLLGSLAGELDGEAQNGTDEPSRAAPMTAPVLAHKSESFRLIGKVNRKIRSCLRFRTSGMTAEDEAVQSAASDRPRKLSPHEITVVDLTSDALPPTSSVHRMTYAQLLLHDKTDSSFCRSQSSSISSLDNVNKEAIQCLGFADTYARKTDICTCPCLWLGTSLGSVLVLTFSVPSDDSRSSEQVSVIPSGTIFRLKGAVLCISFLDCNGSPLPAASESWKDTSNTDDAAAVKEKKLVSRQQSASNMKARSSPTFSSGDLSSDRHFAVFCSEKQARVLSLPSQSCTYKVKITETSTVAKADVVSIKESVCLACYLLNGHIMTFSLPSLKPLLDIDYIPSPDVRVARTICFTSNCHVLYFCSPSELQKLTLSAEFCDGLGEMLGELFLPCDMPEAPKQGFFKNLFNIGSAILDREELFGEAGSGKAAKGVARYSSGIGQAQESAGSAMSEIGRAKQAALERGEKLGALEDRTEQMRNEAEEYSRMANQLKMKYRDKKWYQF